MCSHRGLLGIYSTTVMVKAEALGLEGNSRWSRWILPRTDSADRLSVMLLSAKHKLALKCELCINEKSVRYTFQLKYTIVADIFGID